MKKRHRESNKIKDRICIVIYDLDKYHTLRGIAQSENSDVSSVISNLYESFLDSFDSVQKTIDIFATEKKTPSISADPTTWRKYLDSLNKSEYDELDKFLNTILFLHNKRGKEPF